MKERLIIGDRSLERSVGIWVIVALVALSLTLATWASISGGSGQGPNGIPSPTPTPTSNGPLSTPGTGPGNQDGTGGSANLVSDDAVPADVALEPFFGNLEPTIALLVASTDSLTEIEQQWLDDIRENLGPADALAYANANLDQLSQYFAIFVIDFSSQVDPTDLDELSELGVSLHLIGEAARYADSFSGEDAS